MTKVRILHSARTFSWGIAWADGYIERTFDNGDANILADVFGLSGPFRLTKDEFETQDGVKANRISEPGQAVEVESADGEGQEANQSDRPQGSGMD